MGLLGRLALKRLAASSSSSINCTRALVYLPPQHQHQQILQQPQRYNSSSSSSANSSSSSTTSEKDKSEGREVSVSSEGDGRKKLSKWLPSRLRKGGGGLWRRNSAPAGALVPFNLNHLFSSGFGVGDALLQATENLNRLIENWAPSRLNIGRMKENESSYKLRFELPGLSKEDVKITIEDRFLTIKGEHKDEEEDGSEDDEHWASYYGYYETSLLLPDDAKIEEIKAELKNGVLMLSIPRTEGSKGKDDVKEIEIK